MRTHLPYRTVAAVWTLIALWTSAGQLAAPGGEPTAKESITGFNAPPSSLATQPSKLNPQDSSLHGQDVRTTESLRAEIFGGDEQAADAWVQLNAFIRYSRWSDAAAAAHEILTRQPAVLLRHAREAALYWPARGVIGSLLAKYPDLAAAYQDMYDLNAQALLSEFERGEQLQSLEQLLDRFPFASSAGQALRNLADGYLDRDEFVRAADAFAQLQTTDKSAGSKERAIWACKDATSLLKIGCLNLAAEKVAQIRKEYGAGTVDGPSGPRFKIGEFCDRLENKIATQRRPAKAPFSMDRLRTTTGWSFTFNTPPAEAAFRRKYPDRMPLYTPSLSGGIAYATNGNELRAVEISNGREQWTWAPERPSRYNVEGIQRWLEQLSPTSLRPAITDRYVVFLRPIELAETVHSVCCLDRPTGRLLWQQVAWSDEPESAETAPVAVGDCGFVIVSSLKRFRPDRLVVEHRAVVCFRLETGELVWRSPLPSPRPPTANDTPGGVVAPVVNGMNVWALEDRGTLYCLNRATGEIRWARMIEGAEADPLGRPGSGCCVADDDRVCVARSGSPQIECLSGQSGQRVWAKTVGANVRWMATDGARVFVAEQQMRALTLAGGAQVWHGDPAEPPLGPGCVADDVVLVPTVNALHAYEAKGGRLADRLPWPEKRPLGHLIASNEGVIGLADDFVCKFGKPGLLPVTQVPPQPPPSRTPSQDASVTAEQENVLSRFFPNLRVNPRRSIRESFAAIGQPSTDAPSQWVVYDSEARRICCYSADRSTEPRWQREFVGNVRSIEFDEKFLYILCNDRLEIRNLQDGQELFRKQTGPIVGKVLFGPGRVLWTYEREEGRSKRVYLAGHDARSRRGFDVPIADLGLQTLGMYSWDGDRVRLLGDRRAGERIYLAARIQGEQLRAENQGVAADERVRTVNFSNVVWTAFENRAIFLGAENQAIYCYNLSDGKRLWKCQLDNDNRNKRPIVFPGRYGRYLVWSVAANEPVNERNMGVIDVQTGDKLATVEGQEAFLYKGRLYSLSGRLLRAHEMRDGRVVKAIQYLHNRRGTPVWAQPFGNRLIVALADDQGVIRELVFQDPELAEVVARGRGDHEGRWTELPVHREAIRIDGAVDDWERVRLGWQEISTWRPVADRNGRPVGGERSAGDCSARWRACVRENALYLAVAVRDDRIEPNRWSDCPWIGDSLEVALRGELFARNMPTLTLSLEGPGQCWAAGPKLPPDRTCARYDPLEHEIIYEMAFPWSWLSKAGVLASRGQRGRTEIALALVVNDNDGFGIKGGLEWGEGLAVSWNPSSWQGLRFELFGGD